MAAESQNLTLVWEKDRNHEHYEARITIGGVEYTFKITKDRNNDYIAFCHSSREVKRIPGVYVLLWAAGLACQEEADRLWLVTKGLPVR